MVPTVAVAGPSAASGIAAAPAGVAVAGSVPGGVSLALMAKKKKKRSSKPSGGLTPEAAETQREQTRAAVEDDVEAQRWKDAADETERGAMELGDPIGFKESAEYRLEQAKADRDIEAANAAIETANVALDILYYYDAVDEDEVESDWRPIEPASASSLVSEVQGIVSSAEDLIEEIEAELEETGGGGGATPAGKTKKKRAKKPGLALIAIGGAFSAIGAGGLSMVAAGSVISARKQKEVEELDLPAQQAEVDRLDEEGSRANVIAYIGAGVAVAGLAVGVPLIVVGVMRRKKGGSPPESAQLRHRSRGELRVVPAMSRSFGGVALHGRF